MLQRLVAHPRRRGNARLGSAHSEENPSRPFLAPAASSVGEKRNPSETDFHPALSPDED